MKKERFEEWDYGLAVALMALSIIVLWVLVMRGNAWIWIAAYWLVTVVRNWLGMYARARRLNGDDGEEGEEPRDVDDSFWACGSDDEEEWEGWQPRRNSI